MTTSADLTRRLDNLIRLGIVTAVDPDGVRCRVKTGELETDWLRCFAFLASAQKAAEADWQRVQRGTASLSYTLAKGRPDLIPERTYSLTGIKTEIATIVWLGSHVRHSFIAESFTTSLELESKLPDS